MASNVHHQLIRAFNPLKKSVTQQVEQGMAKHNEIRRLEKRLEKDPNNPNLLRAIYYRKYGRDFNEVMRTDVGSTKSWQQLQRMIEREDLHYLAGVERAETEARIKALEQELSESKTALQEAFREPSMQNRQAKSQAYLQLKEKLEKAKEGRDEQVKSLSKEAKDNLITRGQNSYDTRSYIQERQDHRIPKQSRMMTAEDYRPIILKADGSPLSLEDELNVYKSLAIRKKW